jgi:hypothetical protein
MDARLQTRLWQGKAHGVATIISALGPQAAAVHLDHLSGYRQPQKQLTALSIKPLLFQLGPLEDMPHFAAGNCGPVVLYPHRNLAVRILYSHTDMAPRPNGCYCPLD